MITTFLTWLWLTATWAFSPIYSPFLYSVASLGLTYLVVDSYILQSFRNWVAAKSPDWGAKLIACHQCTGFWCGLLCGAIFVSLKPGVVLGCGFAGSFLPICASHLLNFLEANSSVVVVNGDETHEQ